MMALVLFTQENFQLRYLGQWSTSVGQQTYTCHQSAHRRVAPFSVDSQWHYAITDHVNLTLYH